MRTDPTVDCSVPHGTVKSTHDRPGKDPHMRASTAVLAGTGLFFAGAAAALIVSASMEPRTVVERPEPAAASTDTDHSPAATRAIPGSGIADKAWDTRFGPHH